MSDPILYALLATFALIYLIGLAVWSLRGKPTVTRRDPAFFTDQHVDERRALIRSFEAKAAKGLSEESRSRAHLQAVTKAGDSRS